MRAFVALFCVGVAGLCWLAVMNSKDYGQCLETTMIVTNDPVWVGNITVGDVQIPQYVYVATSHTYCVRWEFPEGRPESLTQVQP